MSRIFINYRRQDTEGYVGRLYDYLARYFERDDLFMEVDITHLDFEGAHAPLKALIFWAIYHETSENRYLTYNPHLHNPNPPSPNPLPCSEPGWVKPGNLDPIPILGLIHGVTNSNTDPNQTYCFDHRYLEAQTILNGLLNYEREVNPANILNVGGSLFSKFTETFTSDNVNNLDPFQDNQCRINLASYLWPAITTTYGPDVLYKPNLNTVGVSNAQQQNEGYTLIARQLEISRLIAEARNVDDFLDGRIDNRTTTWDEMLQRATNQLGITLGDQPLNSSNLPLSPGNLTWLKEQRGLVLNDLQIKAVAWLDAYLGCLRLTGNGNGRTNTFNMDSDGEEPIGQYNDLDYHPASGNFADQYDRMMGHIKAATDTVANGGACDTRNALTYDAYKCDPTQGAVALLAANAGVGLSYSSYVGRAASGEQGWVGELRGFAFCKTYVDLDELNPALTSQPDLTCLEDVERIDFWAAYDWHMNNQVRVSVNPPVGDGYIPEHASFFQPVIFVDISDEVGRGYTWVTLVYQHTLTESMFHYPR